MRRTSQSSEWFIEDEAFSPSCYLAPLLPSPTPSHQKARPAAHRKTEKERQLADGREREGGLSGGGAKSYDGEKAWSSKIIQYSLGWTREYTHYNRQWPERGLVVRRTSTNYYLVVCVHHRVRGGGGGVELLWMCESRASFLCVHESPETCHLFGEGE